MSNKILIIEDDNKIVNFMSMALKAKGYTVLTSKNGNQGILCFCTEKPDMERLIERKNDDIHESVYKFDYLTVDSEKHRVYVEGSEVHLTPIEFKLLLLLIANRGKVITHSQISKEVWGYGETGDSKSIRVFMASLRRKIEKDRSNPRFIFTEIGVGYRFTDE